MFMKFVLQPYGSKQCGQSCLAMILNCDLYRLCTVLNNHWVMDIKDLKLHLELNKYKTELHNREYGFYKFENIPNNSIIRFWNFDGTGHFVLKHDGKYYDPSIGIIEKYYKEIKINMYLTYEKIT